LLALCDKKAVKIIKPPSDGQKDFKKFKRFPPPRMQHLTIGFVGAGFNAQFHIKSLVSVRNCSVGGLVSSSVDSCAKAIALAKSLDVASNHLRAYTDVLSMASDEAVRNLPTTLQ